MNMSRVVLIGVLATAGVAGCSNSKAGVRRAAQTIKGRIKATATKAGRAAKVAIKSQKSGGVVKMVPVGADRSFDTGMLPKGDRYVVALLDQGDAELGAVDFNSGGGTEEQGIPFLDEDGKADEAGDIEYSDIDLGEIDDDSDGNGFEPSINPLSEIDSDGDGSDDLADLDDDDDGTTDELDGDDDGDGLPDA